MALLGLAACGASTPRVDTTIANGVLVTAKPIQYFHQGVRGDRNQTASISNATFVFTCDANFTGGGTLQQRADASAQYSKIAREKVLFWLVNSQIMRELKYEVSSQSASAQRCAVTDLQLTQVTTDPLDVMKFTIDNGLLGKIMEMR
ncbi:MAG: hypothetical protein P8P56_08560 [Yoonia sp.]|nr:hypothetical protein [Yoonia sp.]